MVKVVTYENKKYLLRCVKLEPIIYLHMKKDMVVIRTETGLYVGKLADFENRKLTEVEKSFVDAYAAWFSNQNGEPHEALGITKEQFSELFDNIFT